MFPRSQFLEDQGADPPSCEAYAGAEEGEEEEAAEDSEADAAEEDKAEVETAGPQEIW